MRHALVAILFILLVLPQATSAQTSHTGDSGDTLAVLWASGDPEVAEKVCLMYTHSAAKFGWFEEVYLIIWGPSAKLLAENSALQEKIKQMQADGIKMQACIVCANAYNVTDKLQNLGIEVKGMGQSLTAYLRKNYSLLTF